MIALRHLIQLGLSEKEAQLYIAALQLGSGTVQEIAKKANIKRPTAYVVLDQLIEKGLISRKPSNGGTSYIAENPEKLEVLVDQQKFALSHALPLLKDLHKEEINRPSVKIYEGVEGMKKIYFDTVWKSKTEILYFASIRKINKLYPGLLDQWVKDFNTENSFQAKARELINPDKEDLAYGVNFSMSDKSRQTRVIPKDFPMQFIGTDNAIFDDKVMFVSLEGKLFTTLIKNKVLADTMRTLYELAWSASIPIEKFIEKHKDEYPDLYKKLQKNKKTS